MKVERIDEWEVILSSAIAHCLNNYYDSNGKTMSFQKRKDCEDAIIDNFKKRCINHNVKEIKL